MVRKFTPKVLTANHLIEGDVIYWDADGNWVRDHSAALFINDETQANTLLARAKTQPDIAVGPYLADAALNTRGIPVPSHFREDFRTRGPSNYDHGKQSEV
ncbi:MAG: DUF2849 domain-containing protein [Rhodobacteraceae bacterium]|nr:DUF2849 domain-containing protein [Paracoccaceae bacterium]